MSARIHVTVSVDQLRTVQAIFWALARGDEVVLHAPLSGTVEIGVSEHRCSYCDDGTCAECRAVKAIPPADPPRPVAFREFT